jgi:hypothetical protein
MGVITLLVIASTSPQQPIVMENFLIVDWPSAYKTIIGRPTLNKLKAITSTHHLKMKFLTNNGVGEVQGDQLVARKFYNTPLKAPNNKETLSIGIDFRDEVTLQQGKPIEELIEISVKEPRKSVNIGPE